MGSIGALLLSVAENSGLESAGIKLVEGIASKALAAANLPAEVKTFLEEVLANSEALVGAMVLGTPAANQVSASTQAATTKAVAAAEKE